MIEEKLVRLCENKDRISQKKVYEILAPRLYKICDRYITDAEETEKILSESFFQIFTQIDQLKELNSFESWAKKITLSQCINYLKEKINFDIGPEDMGLEPPSLEIGRRDGKEDELLEFIPLLPEKNRIIFNLHVLDNLSFKEISEQLNIPEETGRLQVNDARKKLQEFKHQFTKETKNG